MAHDRTVRGRSITRLALCALVCTLAGGITAPGGAAAAPAPVTAATAPARIIAPGASLLTASARARCVPRAFGACGPITPWAPAAPRVRLGRPALPASATAAAIQTPCVGATLGAVCGFVDVPFDRLNPSLGTIPIRFELLPHFGSGPAESAILINLGGPGEATTDASGTSAALGLFAPDLDVHDLLLVDDRGRGFSATIDCPELQHGSTPFPVAAARCAAQLGAGASRFGTGGVALDTDAVRAALGYDKVDYFVASYGGADATAYATRFGNHLRSLVLDSPYGPPNRELFVRDARRVRAEFQTVRLLCQRSPTCGPDHPKAAADLVWLVRRVQRHPVEGNAHDAGGNAVHVVLDESAVLNDLLDNPVGNFTNTGEVLAAAAALRNGDAAPALRLAAENPVSLQADAGDPRTFSEGAFEATFCSDNRFPFRWSSTVPQRAAEFQRAVDRQPDGRFAPFSKEVVAANLFNFGTCIPWTRPSAPLPMVPAHATYPNVPALALAGDLDSRVPDDVTRDVAGLFPRSTYLEVAEAGHATVEWSQCAAGVAARFIETLDAGDTTCAATPETVFPAVGRFPLVAADARPAIVAPGGTNQIGVADRKAVTTAVAAATDALSRGLIGPGDGVGLRAGTFHTTFSQSTIRSTLSGCAFAKDVAVDGTVRWHADGSFDADLTLGGPGTSGGTIHVAGTWQAPGPVGHFTVTGVLGGRTVDVLLPEA